jgi:hypothetical protein
MRSQSRFVALIKYTRRWHEVSSQDDFRDLLLGEWKERSVPMTWETIYDLTHPHRKELARLRSYLRSKTCNLRQDFLLERLWQG